VAKKKKHRLLLPHPLPPRHLPLKPLRPPHLLPPLPLTLLPPQQLLRPLPLPKKPRSPEPECAQAAMRGLTHVHNPALEAGFVVFWGLLRQSCA